MDSETTFGYSMDIQKKNCISLLFLDKGFMAYVYVNS